MNMKALPEAVSSLSRSYKVFSKILIIIASALVSFAASNVEVFAASGNIPFVSGSFDASVNYNTTFGPVTSVYDDQAEIWVHTFCIPFDVQFRSKTSSFINGHFSADLSFSFGDGFSSYRYEFFGNHTSGSDYMASIYSISPTKVKVVYDFFNYSHSYVQNSISSYFIVTCYSTSSSQGLSFNYDGAASVSEPSYTTAPRLDQEIVQSVIAALEDSGNVDNVVDYLYDIMTSNNDLYNKIVAMAAYDQTEYPLIIAAINSCKTATDQAKVQIHNDFTTLYNYLLSRDSTREAGAESGAASNESAASAIDNADSEVDEAQESMIDSVNVNTGDIDDLGDSAIEVIESQSTSISFWSSLLSSFAQRSGFIWSIIVLGLVFGLFLFILRLR